MIERFAERMRDPKVRHDVRVAGDFTRVYCRGVHPDRERRPAATDAAALGVYGARPPAVCEECEAHLAYGEKRSAYCPKDPKPFCAFCDIRCYASAEAEWQRVMMRYSGPRWWLHGHLLGGIRHVIDGRRARRLQERTAT